MMVRIFLTGYMGAGKTTLGKAFARELGLSFIDLDWYLEERFHQTISQLFAERGEDGFRRLEQKMLHEVGDFENVVISTGGGTPCFFDNMDYMNAQGQTVFLDVDEETLFRRLRVATAQRPILRGKSDAELTARRWPGGCLIMRRLVTGLTEAGWKASSRLTSRWSG